MRILGRGLRGVGTACFAITLGTGGAAAQDAGSGTLVVANMNDNTATIIDVGSGRTLATLPTGRAPHEIAVTGDGRWAVITNYGDRGAAGRSLTVVDLATVTVARTISMEIYERPHGIAVLPGDSLVAVTSEAQGVVVLVNLHTGDIVTTIPTEGATSHMLAADARGARIFTTNIRDGTISELDVLKGVHVRVIEVAPVVEGLAVSPDGSQVWVGSNRDKTVSVVDVEAGHVVDVLEGFGFPYRMAITPDGATAVLADPANGEIRIVDTATRRELHRVLVPAEGLVGSTEFPGSASPEGIAMSRDGGRAFVSLQGRNQVAALDLASGSVVATWDTGVWPDGIGYSPLVR